MRVILLSKNGNEARIAYFKTELSKTELFRDAEFVAFTEEEMAADFKHNRIYGDLETLTCNVESELLFCVAHNVLYDNEMKRRFRAYRRYPLTSVDSVVFTTF